MEFINPGYSKYSKYSIDHQEVAGLVTGLVAEMADKIDELEEKIEELEDENKELQERIKEFESGE